ncbi:hypothetical protein MUK42_29082 [Musa troglodytarum]|uniref:Uncharacterized protein n=1 Tax=Musa troglodytarum TaxID=320322 RepID=A0A9E7FN44_9LILI|nr:hypothetical protein MUK42_29082 [Musa troglodytarum]
MASHDSGRRRRGLAVLAFVASMFWLLASQSICDGRALLHRMNHRADCSLCPPINSALTKYDMPAGLSSPSATTTTTPAFVLISFRFRFRLQASLPAGSHAAEGVALTSSEPPAFGSRCITVVSGKSSRAPSGCSISSAKATAQTRIISSSQPRYIGAHHCDHRKASDVGHQAKKSEVAEVNCRLGNKPQERMMLRFAVKFTELAKKDRSFPKKLGGTRQDHREVRELAGMFGRNHYAENDLGGNTAQRPSARRWYRPA